jgi:hypothetical protein
MNHNMALRQRHNGTATWFIQGSTFMEWRVTGSLLWIHGKRMRFPDLRFLAHSHDLASHHFSWFRKDRFLVGLSQAFSYGLFKI